MANFDIAPVHTEVADGLQTTYGFPFALRVPSDLRVFVDGVEKFQPADWVLLTASTIQYNGPALPAGTNVEMARDTDISSVAYLFDSGVPFLPRFVDENNKQLLYAMQEAVHSTEDTAEEALAVAEEAKDIAQEALDLVENAVVDSAAALRADLADFADLEKGANLVARSLRQVYSWAALSTEDPLFDGDQVYVTGYYADDVGYGDGLVTWNASSTAPADGGMVAERTGIVTGRWERKRGLAVMEDWYGIKLDGTDQDAKLRAAAAAVPTGGTLFGCSKAGTVTVNSPAGQGRWPAAVNYSTANITILANPRCVYKLKDMSDAYVTYGTTVALGVFRISASGIRVKGWNIDANADHHYEVDGSGFKWFEGEGPTGKRPANGINVTMDIGQANLVGVRVEDCTIYRPLAGVYASGNLSLGGGSLDEPTFFTKTLATDTVVDLVISGCETSYCRGNDYIFIAGVRDSLIAGNVSVNSMYHHARFYAGVESCVMQNNRAYMNYAEIAARWNPTDLGYWRTDNPAAPQGYLIERAGFAIGSTSAQTSANSGNIRRCSMVGNKLWYNSNLETGSIVDTTQVTLASFFVWQVTNDINVENNESSNSPFTGLSFVNSILSLNPATQGVVFRGNRVKGARRRFIYTLGTGPIFTGNEGTNCGELSSPIYCQGGANIFRNTIVWERTAANTNTYIEFVTYGTVGLPFISCNVKRGYTGGLITKLSTDVVHGSDGGGVPVALLAGWAAGTVPLTLTINCAGVVTVQGRIASAAGGTDTYASQNGTLAKYRPSGTNIYPVWQNTTPGVVEGQITSGGSMVATRGALAVGTQFSVAFTYQTNFTL